MLMLVESGTPPSLLYCSDLGPTEWCLPIDIVDREALRFFGELIFLLSRQELGIVWELLRSFISILEGEILFIRSYGGCMLRRLDLLLYRLT